MNAVSFGSTYKLKNNDNNYQNQRGVIDFCEKNNIEYSIKAENESKSNGFIHTSKSNLTTTLIAPDDKDNLIEAYLANKGIKFNKLDSKELLKQSSIKSRINDAPKGMELVYADVKKLEELTSNQDTNIDYCKEDYKKYYKDNVELMFKSGDKIPTTTLHIIPTGESTEDAVNYIKTFGADRLNENQLSVCFAQKTDYPDHCVFFGLNDLGMDKVPVYVDKETQKIGKELGLFK